MRLSVLLTILLGLAGPPQSRPPGTVFTTSDIESPHLFQRPVDVEGRDWLGLEVMDGTSRLARVRVDWVASFEFGDSLFTLAVEPVLPLLLVADVPRLSEGPVTTLSQYGESLSRGETRTYSLGAREYALLLSSPTPDDCGARVTLTLGSVSQELYAPDEQPFSCDEPHFTVEWAGDLDGDGRLDLVTTFSSKYSYYPRRLLLSSAAPDGALVGLVATFDLAAA